MSDSALPELPSLAGGLDEFRVYFNLVYKNPQSECIDDLINQLPTERTRTLIFVLNESLQTSLTAGEVRDQLGILLPWIQSDDSALDHVKPLLKAALADEPDHTLIQRLLRGVIDTLKSIPPPPTTPPRNTSAYDFTPIKASSRSQQGNEQTRDLIERRVFEEIGGFTYRAVPGFWEKYFEGRPWISDASTIYESVKKEHVDGEWVNLRGSPNQEQVLRWVFRLQNASTLLSNAIYGYDTIQLPSELTGGEAKRQINILTRRKSEKLSDTKHWKDIAVIGELKSSSLGGIKNPLLQLACFARDVFTQQPTRRFLHAFMICGRKMEAWIFDRSGTYSGGPFDIHKEPERFIRVLTGYLMMDESELGLDTFVERHADSSYHLIDVPWETGGKKRLELLAKPLTVQRSIVSRATSCFLARLQHSNDDGWNYVVKFSWPPMERNPEHYFLRLAKEKGVVGVVDLLGYYQITTTSSMRDGLQFLEPYSFHGTADELIENSKKRPSVDSGTPQPSKRYRPSYEQSSDPNEVPPSMEDSQWPAPSCSDGYNNRAFRCLVTYPAGRPIYKYKSLVELLEALRDAIKAHESLYTKGNILHRDISENNIIITEKKTGFSGVLIDLDLAKEIGSTRSGALCRTGTMEFMAIEVLLDIDHTYRHDLESFFYVLLWQCINHGWPYVKRNNPWGKNSVLKYWYTGPLLHIALYKQGFIQKERFKDVLREFPPQFEHVKPLCEELRFILFGHEGFTGTPTDDPSVLYGRIIHAFDNAIGEIRGSGVSQQSPVSSFSKHELGDRTPTPLPTSTKSRIPRMSAQGEIAAVETSSSGKSGQSRRNSRMPAQGEIAAAETSSRRGKSGQSRRNSRMSAQGEIAAAETSSRRGKSGQSRRNSRMSAQGEIAAAETSSRRGKSG